MSDKTAIEWTEATWNPLVGCTKVSPGCDNCYAEKVVNRWHKAESLVFPNTFDVVTTRDERMLTQPLRWARPRRIFVNSLSDLFHADVPAEFIARVFAVMTLAEQHTFQLLTKRHARMRTLLNSMQFIGMIDFAREQLRPGSGDWNWPIRNVWLGVSVEDQHWADIRIPALLETPAAVRWISAEPLLGPVTLKPWLSDPAWVDGDVWPPSNARQRSLDWVVVGGESGPGARPMDPDWARQLRDECAATNRYSGFHWMGGPPTVQFLFKQWGNHNEDGKHIGKKAAGRQLDGRTHDDYPTPLGKEAI